MQPRLWKCHASLDKAWPRDDHRSSGLLVWRQDSMGAWVVMCTHRDAKGRLCGSLGLQLDDDND